MKGDMVIASHPLTPSVYQVGEVIHSDIMGHVTPPSLGGAQYVITAKDDGSAKWLPRGGLLEEKGRCWLRDFISRFERQELRL